MPKPRTPDRTAALFQELVAAIRETVLAELQADIARLRAPATRKRVRGQPNPNWPKCPTCGKPAFPHTRPFCKEHGTARKGRAARKR